tara:strand:+ start:8938 stop:9453 length:516 start_codon:yes stop_codon:yes gene_type:complete
MATIFESGGVGDLISIAFVFLFVFVILFALLKKIKLFGDNEGFNSIVAFIFASFTVMVPESRVVVGNFLPWFFMFFMLALVMFMFFMFLGVKEETMAEVAKNSTFITVSIATVIILFLMAMTKAYGPFLMAGEGAGFWPTTKRLIFSRNFLGVIFMLFVSAYAVIFLSKKN